MNPSTGTEELVEEFVTALLALDRLTSAEIVNHYSAGHGPQSAIENLVIPSIERIGDRFDSGEIALSQKYMSGRICEEAVENILPGAGSKNDGHAPIAIAVLDDHHALGKKIVYLTLRSAGYQIIDYGMGLSVDELVQRTIADDVRILIISVLMLPSAMKIREVGEELRKSGKDIKIVAGGAPFRFDQDLGREVGADASADRASQIINVVAKFLKDVRDD